MEGNNILFCYCGALVMRRDQTSFTQAAWRFTSESAFTSVPGCVTMPLETMMGKMIQKPTWKRPDKNRN